MTTRVGAVLIIGVALTATSAGAQEVRFGVSRAGSDHELLGSPLALEAAIGARIAPRLGIRFGLQYGRDDFASTGSTCVGLVPPGEDCGPELRRDEATTRTLYLSLPVTERFGWGEVSLVPGFRRLTMKSRQEGTVSGRRREADKVVYGFGLGIEGEVYVWRTPAIALHVGGYGAKHPWFTEEVIADGYTPFEESTRLTWLEVGLTALLGTRDPAP